jgi:glutaminase
MTTIGTREEKSLLRSISGKGDIPTINECRNYLISNGFQIDDPRWNECFEKLFEHEFLNEKIFHEIFHSRMDEFRSLVNKDLAIPQFENFTFEVDQIYYKVKRITTGQLTKQIPQLGKVNPDLFGYSVCSINGQRYSKGDSEEHFTVQGAGNPIIYAIALEMYGLEGVHKLVDKEPSGQSYNAITFTDNDLPYNPMINAGAIALCSLVEKENDPSVKFESVLKWWKELAGGFKPGFDNSVYLSERINSDQNYALARLMKAKGILKESDNIVDILEFYFQCCSIEMDCNKLSIVAATLANGGVCPLTNKRIFDTKTTRSVLSLMYSCGMYEESGQFSFNVGLPAKSGISGCTMIIVPGVCGFAVYSPKLDEYSNSTRGIAFANELAKKFPFHNFDVSDVLDAKKKRSEQIVQFFYACFENDIMIVRKMIRLGMDINLADYDGRTAMHIACSEGNYETVQLLLQHRASFALKDRWGKTALDNAVEGGYFDIENSIRKLQFHRGLTI